MYESILAAGITAAATIICQLIISRRTNSLISYRVGELEKEAKKHNNFMERLRDLEVALTAVEARAKSNSHRLDKLEE